MPLKLVNPRPGKTPYYSVRGTHLSIYVDRSTKTTDRKQALKILKTWKEEIERGQFAKRSDPTFLSAAISYMRAGGERTYMGPLLKHFKTKPLKKIGQSEIDEAADKLCQGVTAATKNRKVYTPVSAVLRHAGVNINLKRPKGSAGRVRTEWLWPEQAFLVFKAASKIDNEFRAFLILLCYTGMRISDALNLYCDDLRIKESFLYVAMTKNGLPRPVFLPDITIKALNSHPRGLNRPGEKLFKFSKNGHLYNLLKKVKEKAGNEISRKYENGKEIITRDLDWVTFHTFCHTWATWMRRYAGLDEKGLVATGRWKDIKSASRYAHVVVDEESLKAKFLPAPRFGGKPAEKESA